MSRLSGWANQLGVAIFGPDPTIEERRVKTERVAELQKIISRAGAVERLVNAPGFAEYIGRVSAMRDDDVRALIKSKAEDRERLQGSIAAYQNVLDMNEAEVEQARLAREELEQMIEDEI